MNGNDLMNALSGLDPKYIDEAALELHGKPESQNSEINSAGKTEAHQESQNGSDSSSELKSDGKTEAHIENAPDEKIVPIEKFGTKKKTGATQFKRYLLIAVPVAAAALLTVAVAMPAIIRMNKGDMASTPAPSSDSAEYAPSYGAEEPSYYAEESASDASIYHDAEKPAIVGDHANGTKDSAADVAPSFSAEEPSGAYESAEEAEPSYGIDGLLGAYETAETESEEGSWSLDTTNDGDTEASKSEWSLTQATYYEGFLILHTGGTVPEDLDELTYTIKRTNADSTDSSSSADGSNASDSTGSAGDAGTVIAEGNLRNILTQTKPITMDITTLNLPAGTYTLTIAGESVEFTVTAE